VGCLQVFFQLLSSFLTKWKQLTAAKVLHNNMLRKILR
jgi:hypothetical protein